MDAEEFDASRISAEAVKASEPRWSAVMTMLVEAGYIKGVEIKRYKCASTPTVLMLAPRITLEGVQYLEENSAMRKIADTARGIASVIC